MSGSKNKLLRRLAKEFAGKYRLDWRKVYRAYKQIYKKRSK